MNTLRVWHMAHDQSSVIRAINKLVIINLVSIEYIFVADIDQPNKTLT